MTTLVAWLRQIAVHSPAILVGLAVAFVGDATLAIAWFGASRLAYVLYVGASLRAASRRRAAGETTHAETEWTRFRRISSTLMDNDAIAFGALCIVTRGTVILEARWAEIAVGVALVVLGVGVKMWAAATLAPGSYHWRSFFDDSAASDDLTRAGPYRWLSHPMYTVGYAHAYGFALALGSVEGLFAAAVAQAAILLLNALVERPHTRSRRDPRNPV